MSPAVEDVSISQTVLDALEAISRQRGIEFSELLSQVLTDYVAKTLVERELPFN